MLLFQENEMCHTMCILYTHSLQIYGLVNPVSTLIQETHNIIHTTINSKMP